MRVARRLALACFLSAVPATAAALASLGQTPVAPPRDVSGKPEQPGGKCVLRGRVLDALSGLPIKGATVTLSGQHRQEPPATSTDAEGRWEIGGLPAGEYYVGVAKGGYVDHGVDHGRSIGLTERRPERTVDLRLVRGAVLSGRVTDEDGEPVVGAQVTGLVEMPTSAGRRGWAEIIGASTDDRGEFRLFGLGPGEYVLAAKRSDRSSGARTASTGRRLADVRTYYPGTTELAEAQRFTLAEAAEYSDLAFSLQTLPSISVSGRVVVSADRIRHGFGTIMPKGDRPEINMGASGPVMVEHDGTFRAPGVTAGTHRLSVYVELSNGEPEIGELDVTAGDEDISGLVLSTHGATRLAGRIVAEPAGARRPEAISVSARTSSARMDLHGNQDAMVKPDGTFELKVFHSPVMLSPSGNLEGWAPSGMRWKGRQVGHWLSFELGHPIEGVELVLRRATSRLAGSVSGVLRASDDADEGTVVAFRDGGDDPTESGVAGMVPIRDGRFTLGPMPAGQYQLVAVRVAGQSLFGKSEVVERLRARATVVTVGDNETKSVNLTLVTDY